MANCDKRCKTFLEIAKLTAKCARCKGESGAPDAVSVADVGRLPRLSLAAVARLKRVIFMWCGLRQIEATALQHFAQGGNLVNFADTLYAVADDVKPLTSAPPDEAERMTREIYRGIVRKFGSGWRDFRALALDTLADRTAV